MREGSREGLRRGFGITGAGGGGARESRMWATRRSRGAEVEGVRRRWEEGVGFGGGVKEKVVRGEEGVRGGGEGEQAVRARRDDSVRRVVVQAEGCGRCVGCEEKRIEGVEFCAREAGLGWSESVAREERRRLWAEVVFARVEEGEV